MKVPASLPYFSEEDIEFIIGNFKDILNGKSFLSMGKYGEQFEREFAQHMGTSYAVACNSGTSALELIFRAIGVEGKEVILPTNTFIATANAIMNAGGIPVFADCGDNMCLDADDAESRITSNTAAIATVHIGGIVSNSTLRLQEICRERGLFLVEDAAQAHGSSLNGNKAGSFGVAAGFSFFSTKVMTTGEGGIVVTDKEELIPRMKSAREFGKVKKSIFTNYHTSIGYNWRMPEVSALLGLRQLKSLDLFIKRRQQIANIYSNELSGMGQIRIIHPEKNSYHNYFKYMFELQDHDRLTVHERLTEAGISPSGYVYELPLHKMPVFSEYNDQSLPKSERLCSGHMCLPIFFSMTDEQVIYVAKELKQILNGCTSA